MEMGKKKEEQDLEKMVATKSLRLAMETDEKRKARLEKMIVTTQLRLALETEEERRAKNGLDMNLSTYTIIEYEVNSSRGGRRTGN